jgi:hypothetical protein
MFALVHVLMMLGGDGVDANVDAFGDDYSAYDLALPRPSSCSSPADDTNVADTTYVRIPSNIIQEGISPAILPRGGRGFYDYTPSIPLRGFFT